MSGFQAVRNQGDAAHAGCLETYDVPVGNAAILCPGMAVKLLGTSSAGTGRAQIVVATTSTQFLGVIDSVDPDYSTEALSDTALPASTAGSVKVLVDPNKAFAVDVENGPLVVTEVGLNAGIVLNVATKTGGITTANQTLNASTAAATVTLPWRIVQLLEDSAGVLGNRALVRPNTTSLAAGTVGV